MREVLYLFIFIFLGSAIGSTLATCALDAKAHELPEEGTVVIRSYTPYNTNELGNSNYQNYNRNVLVPHLRQLNGVSTESTIRIYNPNKYQTPITIEPATGTTIYIQPLERN